MCPKLSQEFTLTLRVGDPRFNQYAKIGLKIDEIETSVPIAPQLEETRKALQEVWKFVSDSVDKEFTDLQENYDLDKSEKK